MHIGFRFHEAHSVLEQKGEAHFNWFPEDSAFILDRGFIQEFTSAEKESVACA